MAQPVEKALGGKYEILQKIREGGMGAIYKVRHRLLDEIRIIKVLKSDLAMDETLRQRFQNEARFAIQLRHPNIAHLYDFSVSAEGRSAYIVMEYIDGVTVQELIAENGAPTVGLGVEIAAQGLKAVSYLHHQGFVHRDIAPDNLMLTRDFQGNPLVKLIDLGIAKGQNEEVNLTATGIFMGKVRYSPPELFKSKGGASELDKRSDLYSFGVLLYELLTGRSPFSGDTFSEIVAGHLFRPPLSFEESDRDGRVPGELRALCLAALEKDPERRVATAEDFLAKLSPFAAEPPSHVAELEQAIEATTQLATIQPPRTRGSSTQKRLDQQFGVAEGSANSAELNQQRDEAVSHAATAIREKTLVGDRASAQQDLEMAVTLFGDHDEFESLQRQLRETPDVGSGAAAVDHRKVEPPPCPTAPGGLTAWLRSPLGLLLTVGVVLILAGMVWALSVSEEPDTVAVRKPMVVEAARRWQAADTRPPVDPLAAVEVPDPVPVAVEAAERAPAAPSGSRVDSPAPPANAVESSAALTVAPVAPPSGSTPDVRRGELFGPDPGVTPPSLLRVPPAVYPPKFDGPRKEIEVLVEVLVSEDGVVITGKAAPRESAKKRFRELAVETSRGATFRPATKYGVEGKMWTTIRVLLPPG